MTCSDTRAAWQSADDQLTLALANRAAAEQKTADAIAAADAAASELATAVEDVQIMATAAGQAYDDYRQCVLNPPAPEPPAPGIPTQIPSRR